MIIDLTIVFNALHSFWDVIGFIFGSLLVVFMPIAVVAASVIKIQDKLENK